MMDKRIVLTGANGFIGKHLIPILLADGYTVHCISRRADLQSTENLFWHTLDLLTESDQLSTLLPTMQCHQLLHLAWVTEPGKYWRSPLNYDWLKASVSLFQAFAKAGGKRIIGVGTCAEYDWRYGLCSESLTPLANLTPYATTKNALAQLLKSYAQETGLNWAWGRIFFPFGPGEHFKRLIPSVINGLLKKNVVQCTHGEQIRDFLYVKDMASALFTLVSADVSGIFNLASGQPLSVKEMILKLADKIEGRMLIELGALPFPEKEPLYLMANIQKLTALGWQAQYTLEAALDETINWWVNQC